ncbi:MAG: type VI secretion protein IcmF/TssM N-terminal domain-containing protein [Candidatus Polarisedimenticolia bacterium]|nr:hypothetical protein [bacterium]
MSCLALLAALPDVAKVNPSMIALVWPAGVAVLLLALLVAAILLRLRPAVWPLGVGFVAQTIGALLVFFRVFASGFTALWITIAAIVVAVLVVVGVSVSRQVRARQLERKLLQGLSDAPSVDEQQLARLRQDMAEALDLLRRAGRGRDAIYTMPWLLVVGRPQAGKTVAIKNSGLQLPVRKDWVKGVGGTHTCDWFFTDELIFLDTPGQWVTEGSGPNERRVWIELLRMLRKNRGARPLDGLVVVVPSEDLVRLDEAQLREQAGKIRDVIDFAQEELGFRFPVYVVVSKCDLVDGFVEFFRGLSPARKNEILGWASARTTGEPASMVREAMDRVCSGLAACRLESLARVASRRQARRLFFFPEEFRRLEAPLAAFASALFRDDPFHEAPLARGFFFTSGTQGEGTPLGRAMAELARTLGVAPAAAAAADDEPKRSYFLLDLFKKRIAGDAGLVSRTSGGGSRGKRAALALSIAPAALGLLLLALSLNSLSLNGSLYRQVQADAPRLVEQLRATGGSAAKAPEALEATGKLADYQRKLAGFSFWRGFGMRRAAELGDLTGQLFKRGFEDDVLKPTLSAAERIASDKGQGCVDRLAMLGAVAKLQVGGGMFSDGAPTGIEKAWKLDAARGAAPAAELARQFAVYKDAFGGGSLPGFSLRKVGESIKNDCFGRSGGSALEVYVAFQNACEDKSAPADLRECYAKLNEALRAGQASGEALQTSLDGVKESLGKLAESNSEAASVKAQLESVQAASAKSNECVGTFAKEVAPLINEYGAQDELVDQCREEVKSARDPAAKQAKRDDVLRQQGSDLKPKEDALRQKMGDFSDKCRNAVPGLSKLEVGVLKRVTEGYRRTACLDLGSQWGDVASTFGALNGKFPFGGGANAPVADLKSVVDVFGGATGFAVKFREATQGKGLTPAAQRWLDQALALSKVLFEEGTDTPRPLKLRLTLSGKKFDPSDLEKKLKVEPIVIRLGEGDELSWREGDPATREATVELFGSRASEVASISAVLAQRKGFLGRTFGSAYKEGKPFEIASTSGSWAPLKLLQKGGAGQTVSFSFEPPLDKKGGKVTLEFNVEGGDVARLIQLMRGGFPPPPAQGAGE